MPASKNENTLNILVASDIHVGFKDKDPERKKDTFDTLKEIFSIAKDRKVDFVLLGGDLFHENKPSRKTLHSTMELFQNYCLGDKPCQFEVISDQASNFGHTSSSITCVNYENPNMNISMPVFSIHGNHDDPTGDSELSAIDILSVAGLLNHFGKQTSLDNIEISPVLLQKGTTKLALYGLGSTRDERLYRLFENKKVTYFRPQEDIDEWYNIFVLHQNRVKHGLKNYIPEQFIDEFFDLVVWGHEHECLIDPQQNPVKNFHVMQPGSPVATSLCEAESKPKHVAVLKVNGKEMEYEKIPLRTVRQLYVETIVLSDHLSTSLSPEETEKKARKYCKQRVEALLQEAAGKRSGHKDQPEKPLIRLRIDYSGGFNIFSAYKFGAEFADRVANPDNIVHFLKRSKKKDNAGADARDIDAMIGVEEVETVKVEDLVQDFLNKREKKDQMSLLTAQEISEAVGKFVDKQEKGAIFAECQGQMEKTEKYILNKMDQNSWERGEIVTEVQRYHEEREKELQSKTQASAVVHSSTDHIDVLERRAPRPSMASNVSVNEEMEVDSDESRSTRKRAAKAPTSRGRGSRGGSRGGGRKTRNDSSQRNILSYAKPTPQPPSASIDLTLDDDVSQASDQSMCSKNPRSSRSKGGRKKGVTYNTSSDEDFKTI